MQEGTTQLKPPSAQAETTQVEPPSVQASVSTVGQIDGDATEASLTTLTMGRPHIYTIHPSY